MKIERSLEVINENDIEDLYFGSKKRLNEYFINGKGAKWKQLYNIESPLAVALCQGAAMHYYDKANGIKDFDVWFFYPFNKSHLPYRTIWTWDYKNPKFGFHPNISGYDGRRVDVLVRSIRNYSKNNPVDTIHRYLENENTSTSLELAKKAVVMLYPKKNFGRVVWYKQKL